MGIITTPALLLLRVLRGCENQGHSDGCECFVNGETLQGGQWSSRIGWNLAYAFPLSPVHKEKSEWKLNWGRGGDWPMLKAPDFFAHGAVRKILQTRRPDPAFWLWLCHLPACELGRVTEEALEVIAKGPSGSDAESKSGSSLGSSCNSPFASWRNSPPASQTHEAGVLEKVGVVYSM